jgi:hypothetical protein
MKTSETSKHISDFFRQLISLSAFPSIALSMLAFQLLGKRCIYRRGNFEVTPLEPLTMREYWFTRLFPPGVLVLSILGVMLIGYSLGFPLT